MMQNLPIHFLPSVQWFAKSAGLQDYGLDTQSRFQRQTPLNHCLILTANGIFKIIVPICNTGRKAAHLPINEVRISYSVPWQSLVIKTIRSAYGSSSFFIFYKDEFEALIQTKHIYLWQFNLTLIEWMNLQFGLHPNVQIGSGNGKPEDLKEYLDEYRQVFGHKMQFVSGLSAIDLLFNLGPDAGEFLRRGSFKG